MEQASETNVRGIELRRVGQRRTFEEILDQLEANITTGRLSAGDRLPAERELASRLGVSRTSVREALRVLEALGIVNVQRGADRGVMLLEEPGNAFSHLLRLHLALSHVSIESIVEFLIMIQCWAARAVARGAPAEGLAELETIVTAMEDPALGPEDFHELDADFHATLGRICENELVSLVLEGCSEALRRLILQVVLNASDWAQMRRDLAREHHEIYAALANGDVAQAEGRIREHLVVWCERAIAVSQDEASLSIGGRDEWSPTGRHEHGVDEKVEEGADRRGALRL